MEANTGIAFWLLAFVTIFAALMVVTLRNIFHCALFLIMCLFGVAGIFVLLGAEFLAAAQVLIYVGAVAILMIFAIMLTSNIASNKIVSTDRNWPVPAVVCLAFALGMVEIIRVMPAWVWNRAELPGPNVLVIGKLLMTEFMLPFEVVSILMLAAMIGAIVLARGAKS